MVLGLSGLQFEAPPCALPRIAAPSARQSTFKQVQTSSCNHLVAGQSRSELPSSFPNQANRVTETTNLAHFHCLSDRLLDPSSSRSLMTTALPAPRHAPM